MNNFDAFAKAEGNRLATDHDIQEIAHRNARIQADLFIKHCIGPDPSKLMPPKEWRRIFDTDVLPKNLATMRAGGWSEDQIAIYLPALHGELDAMLLSYADHGLTSRPIEDHRR